MNAVIANLPFLMGGLVVTLGLAAATIIFSAVLGTLVGIARLSKRPYLHYPAVAYIEVVRGVPAILLILYMYFVLIQFGYDLSVFWTGVLALSISASSYLAEVVRSGISGIDPGQMEAARSSGLSYMQAMFNVILPQALRRMAPALVSEFTRIVKNTSLVAVIGGFELFSRANITNSRVLTEPFMIFGFVAVLYFLLNYSLSWFSKRLELRADV